MNTQQITLPADVYDTLELAALEWGGIGAGGDFDATSACPLCAHGLLREAAGSETNRLPLGWYSPENPSYRLSLAGVRRQINDDAVRAINGRKGIATLFCEDLSRVTFEEWAKELNIVRGDE